MRVGMCSLWYGTAELLPELLRLVRTGQPDEVVIVDNASPEAAPFAQCAARLQAGGFDVRLLRSDTNDVLAGWNAGMEALTTDVRVCMASDLLALRPAWLDEIARWCMPGNMVGPWPMVFEGRYRYLDGSLIAYHEIDWRRLGGLDALYEHPGYMSDVDICWRAEQMGIMLKACAPWLLHLRNYTAGPPEANREGWLRNRARFLERVSGNGR